jgi:hypothetical protein
VVEIGEAAVVDPEGLLFCFGIVAASNAAKGMLLDAQPIWTGVSVASLSGVLARVLNLPQPAGLLVMHAAEDLPERAWASGAGT